MSPAYASALRRLENPGTEPIVPPVPDPPRNPTRLLDPRHDNLHTTFQTTTGQVAGAR